MSPPKGYNIIIVHLVFAVKFDGRHRDGHLTPEPIESIYSGVVTLRNLRLVIFLGKLNNLNIWGADIGNTYLEVRKAGFRRDTLAFCDWNQQNWNWRQSDRADMRGS